MIFIIMVFVVVIGGGFVFLSWRLINLQRALGYERRTNKSLVERYEPIVQREILKESVTPEKPEPPWEIDDDPGIPYMTPDVEETINKSDYGQEPKQEPEPEKKKRSHHQKKAAKKK